jgi:uncharacterized protein DUF1573
MRRSSLNKIVIQIGILLFLAVTFSYAQEKGDAATPRVKFSETRYEAGQVKEGVTVSHEFEFINEGNAVLRITDLVPA